MNTRHFLSMTIAALTTAIFTAPSGFAQILLTASNYALLGGTAISVGGPGPNSIYNGNVGLSAAATSNITGFPPGTVSGNTVSGSPAAIIATGGATQQAGLDLIAAKAALAAMPSNVNVSNVNLGTMAPLDAGVYTFTGAANQTGALVLDAQGHNGVSWVFQIATSLTTAVNSTVTIINLGSNGGSDLGIYWNVGSAISIGDNNTILGNYLAGTSITFTGSTATLGGGGSRALAEAGVSFAGPGSINVTGGPRGGDFAGGLVYNNAGQVVPLANGGPATGNVLLAATGAFTPGISGLTLVPGISYPATNLTIDGRAVNGSAPASLIVNTATVTLTGSNTYTGGTTVNNGVLITGSANLPANQNVALNNSTLNFNQTADGTFGGLITGGTITKTGAGALTLTNTTISPVMLQTGFLYMYGGLGSTTISRGAVLGGNGTISGNLTNNGTVSPGLSPGTITVTGNYAQSSTGILQIQIAPGNSFDKLIIAGTATLAGTLQLQLLGHANAQAYTFLTAAGGVTGTFNSVTGVDTGSPAIVPLLKYSSNAVTLELAQLSFASFGQTANQAAIGNAANASPAVTTTLNALSAPSQYPGALSAISPQGYEIWSAIAFANATGLTDSLTQGSAANLGYDNYYIQSGQRRARVGGNLDVGATDYTSTETLVGGDHAFDANHTWGLFVGAGESSAGLGSLGSTTSVKETLFGGRAIWTEGPWFGHAVIAYGFDDYKASRFVTFPGVAAVATSSTRGHQWLADLSVGRRFSSGIYSLSPFAGVLVSNWQANGFSEAGAGVYNVTLGGQTAHSLRSQAGLEGQLDWQIGPIGLRPHFRAAWLSEFSDDARALNGTLGTAQFTVATRGPQRDSALLGAGLDFKFSPRSVLYTEYTAQSSGRIKYLSDWRAGLSVRF